MNLLKEPVRFCSLGDEIAGTLFLPASQSPLPVLIVCHGAGEFKENYFEMCERLAERSVASLAIDMHGHGQSGGQRFYVDMRQWVADIRAALDFLSTRPEVDSHRAGAFGLSSGGTAILEAGIVEPRLKVLIGLDATVRNSLPFIDSILLRILVGVGRLKRCLTGGDFRVPLAKLPAPKMASDPEVERRLMSDPHSLEAFMAFPLPGGEQAFFVDTITRVSRIKAPTLVIWGEDDKLDPPETGRLLSEALTCKKQLQVVPGNGHVGHLDRNRAKVFALTADWVLDNLMSGAAVACQLPSNGGSNTCESH
jgi:pimeloyl-ACP methyl ester carboxylesterase